MPGSAVQATDEGSCPVFTRGSRCATAVAAVALLILAVMSSLWLLLVPAALAAVIAGLLAWLSRRVPFERLPR